MRRGGRRRRHDPPCGARRGRQAMCRSASFRWARPTCSRTRSGSPATARELAAGPASRAGRRSRRRVANGEMFLLMAGAGFDGRVIEALSHAAKGGSASSHTRGPLLRALKDATRYPRRADRRTAASAQLGGHHQGASLRRAFVIAPRTSVREAGPARSLFDASNRIELLQSLVALATGPAGEEPSRARRRPDSRVENSIQDARCRCRVDGDAFGTTPLIVRPAAGRA